MDNKKINIITSFPKSGNTWMRFIIYDLFFNQYQVNINNSLEIKKKIPDLHTLKISNKQIILDKSLENNKVFLKTHFGFDTVLTSKKAGLVQNVFSSVASNYDIMNDVMSLGVHRLWKDALINWINPQPGQKLLDVAGGTGDISFRFIDRAKGMAHATILDMTESMLIEGQKRSESKNFTNNLDWVCGDAMSLPFEDNCFDIYAISFGIRNVVDIEKAIKEAHRVLKAGGRIIVLEFGKIPDDLLQNIYDKYSFNVIPKLGKVIAGDEASYKYLVQSIRKFPEQDSFSKLLTLGGFENVKYRNFSFGIAAIHSGWKI